MNWSLRRLIIIVAVVGIVLTGIGSINAGYRVSQEVLMDGTLETNRVYAEKVAITTNNHLKTMLKLLEYSSNEIAKHIYEDDAEEELLGEANRIKKQTETFNTTIIADKEGIVIAASDDSPDLIGMKLSSVGAIQALTERKSFISKPYTGKRGRNVVFLSSPIFDENKNYFGFVGGAIYLEEENILATLLGEHFYQDGSYVYVVDSDGRIIHHKYKKRINEVVSNNDVLEDVIAGNDGAQRIVNSVGVDMLAGYAYVPVSEWGIISQRPTDVTLLPSEKLLKEMIVKAIPFLVITLILIIIIANKISKPLHELATYAKRSTESQEDSEVPTSVQAWYYEAIELKKALLSSVAYFREKVNYFIHESTTDPLTGLKNRRAMDKQMDDWYRKDKPFAFIILDIDKFKRINDRYGHSVGDEVLIYLADEMRNVVGESNICCRFGGEEFVILLPETSLQESYEVAEKLRKKLEVTKSPCGEIITISSGIAHMPGCATHLVNLVEIADNRLYHAKETGRNKTVMYDEEIE